MNAIIQDFPRCKDHCLKMQIQTPGDRRIDSLFMKTASQPKAELRNYGIYKNFTILENYKCILDNKSKTDF